MLVILKEQNINQWISTLKFSYHHSVRPQDVWVKCKYRGRGEASSFTLLYPRVLIKCLQPAKNRLLGGLSLSTFSGKYRVKCSLRSKRFRLVLEQRKTEERDSRFWLPAPFFAQSLTLVPHSLLLNRAETLATQAR